MLFNSLKRYDIFDDAFVIALNYWDIMKDWM